jgi:sugar/nucleoside kinase (ribokinase family)
MALTVVGSIAYDAVKTPFGERERMLGGAAVHFALAASFFDDVHIVGPVGDDFDGHDVLHARGVNTELNVFETFQPKLSEASKAAETLFLANIQPDLQLEVRRQCENARFVALDSMDLWINIARESLERVIAEVDCLILNDEEIEMLTGKPTIVGAAREVLKMGPKVVIAKQGKYGAGLITEEGTFWLPAYPMEEVVDPTGAGDTFAGGFVGYLAAHADEEPTVELLRRAMAYGTAIASYNVQEFGTDRVARLTGEEIAERVEELQRITQFTDAPIALRH